MPSVALAVRSWKPGLSTSHWYLAPCSVPVSPEEHRTNSGFWEFATRFFFYGPLYLAVTCAVFLRLDSLVFGVRHWSTRVWIFLEDEFWYVSVFSTPWFDIGNMLGVSLRGLLGFDCELRILRSCSSSKVVDILVFTQFPFTMVLFQKTIEIHQLLVDTMADVPFVPIVQVLTCRLWVGQSSSHSSCSLRKSLCLLRTSRFTSPSRRSGKSMVQIVRLIMDILQLLIPVADVPVSRSCSSRVHTWRRQSSSHG